MTWSTGRFEALLLFGGVPGPGGPLHLAHHLAAIGHLLAGAARDETGRSR